MKLNFSHCNENIEFDLIYRNRNTIGIKICHKNGLVVHSPKGVKPEEIKKILQNKINWIIKKLAEVNEANRKNIQKNFLNGEKFLFLGEEHVLKIVIDDTKKKPVFNIDYGKIILQTNTMKTEEIRRYFEGWYKNKAFEIILERITYYQKFFNIKPNIVKVKNQKSRWGTCNSRKNLYFNWKIVMAPIEILDYLVVHEMSHLVYMNHSPKFWNCVEKILPDYKESRKILKKFGSTYTF